MVIAQNIIWKLAIVCSSKTTTILSRVYTGKEQGQNKNIDDKNLIYLLYTYSLWTKICAILSTIDQSTNIYARFDKNIMNN